MEFCYHYQWSTISLWEIAVFRREKTTKPQQESVLTLEQRDCKRIRSNLLLIGIPNGYHTTTIEVDRKTFFFPLGWANGRNHLGQFSGVYQSKRSSAWWHQLQSKLVVCFYSCVHCCLWDVTGTINLNNLQIRSWQEKLQDYPCTVFLMRE